MTIFTRSLPHLRACRITRPKLSATASTSSKVASRPGENRTSEFANSAPTPIASNTCDGVSDPAEHAAPLDAQIPSKSSPASNVVLSQPATVNAAVFAKRPARAPRNRRGQRWRCPDGMDPRGS